MIKNWGRGTVWSVITLDEKTGKSLSKIYKDHGALFVYKSGKSMSLVKHVGDKHQLT
jgi:hypothetical protein